MGVVHAAHPQDLSSMAVLQPQKVIHDSSSLHYWRMRSESNALRFYQWASRWQQTVRRSDLAVDYGQLFPCRIVEEFLTALPIY